MVRIVFAGVCGKMGREVAKYLLEQDDFKLVGGVDVNFVGSDLGEVLGTKFLGINITNDLQKALEEAKPDVLLDFTSPKAVKNNLKIALTKGVSAVVGTSGITDEDILEVEKYCEQGNSSAIIAPNFSIGALLLMKFAAEAAKYFPNVEIIEYHHNQKLDAPSGTAVKTAELILENAKINTGFTGEFETLPGARGGTLNGIKIHSVRLPGFLAHQEVIFGSQGQILSLRHDSLSRESFFYGINFALKKIKHVDGVVYGIENILDN